MKKSNITVVLMVLVLAVLAASCAPAPAATSEPAGKAHRLRVVASFHAIGQLVSAVGGDRIELSQMVPDGASAHGFEPKAQDMLALSQADLLVLNGVDMEAWAAAAVAGSENTRLTVLDTSQGLDLIELADADGHEADGHAHAGHDPHIWLGLTTAAEQVKAIRDTLVKLDEANKDFYERNAASFVTAIDRLLSDYKPRFDALTNKAFVTGHAAFAYLCRDLGLEQNSVQNVFADGEPSAQQLAALIDFSRQHKVTTIFAERLASPAVSETLADEVGAKVETIYTLESAEDGKSFLERVELNLAKILAALQG